MSKRRIDEVVAESVELKKRFFALQAESLVALADVIADRVRQGGKVLVFGNGGSGTTASHFSEDLGKSTLRERELKDESKKRLKVLSLTDNLGWIMAVGNDIGYDQIFVQQLMNYGSAGDVCIAISGLPKIWRCIT